STRRQAIAPWPPQADRIGNGGERVGLCLPPSCASRTCFSVAASCGTPVCTQRRVMQPGELVLVPGHRSALTRVSEHHLSVDVLIQQVAEVLWAAGVAGLGAEGAQREIVALLDFDPVSVQPVDGLALQNIETM